MNEICAVLTQALKVVYENDLKYGCYTTDLRYRCYTTDLRYGCYT